MNAIAEPTANSTLANPLNEHAAQRLGIRNILVPTDFSPAALHAVDYAARFAEQVRAHITLLHVVEPLTTPDVEYLPLMIHPEKLVAMAQHKLADITEDKDAALFNASRVRNGIAFYEITEAAKQLKVDLILLATNGFSGLQHVWLGSTAERVVRHAHCPVLIVGPPERRHGRRAARDGNVNGKLLLKRILAPVDFSDPSEAALRYSSRLGATFGSSIDLLYVVESLHKLQHLRGLPEHLSTAAAEQVLREKLAALANEQIEDWIPAFSHTRVGQPVEQILSFAIERAADLLVIATHGRTGLKHVLLGSVAERVVRQAACPVLVVRQS